MTDFERSTLGTWTRGNDRLTATYFDQDAIRIDNFARCVRDADGETPVTLTNVSREQIERGSWGQDVPVFLSEVPGFYAYSDNGHGIGYSYFTLRGFDMRRNAVTLNGVPLNDAESHGVFFVDLRDRYGLPHRDVRGIDHDLAYRALAGGARRPGAERERRTVGDRPGDLDVERRHVVVVDRGAHVLNEIRITELDRADIDADAGIGDPA